MRNLFIASLGNPGAAYAETLHSAGHVLLSALVTHAEAQPLHRSATYSDGHMTEISGAAFWKSPSYMNDSGRALVSAWRKWAARPSEHEPLLIVLHDDLELTLGKFKIKGPSKGLSHRGHNGMRSIMAMPGMQKLTFTRVGVGIGPRPKSREPQVVADFVLQRMTREQLGKIEDLARPLWRRLV